MNENEQRNTDEHTQGPTNAQIDLAWEASAARGHGDRDAVWAALADFERELGGDLPPETRARVAQRWEDNREYAETRQVEHEVWKGIKS